MPRLHILRFSAQLRRLQSYSSPVRFYSAALGKMTGNGLLGGHEKKHKVTIVGSGNW